MEKSQHFLQVIMHRDVLNEQEMNDLSRNIYGDQEVLKHIREVNRSLEGLGMAVKPGTCELSGRKYYFFVGTVLTEVESCEDEIIEFSKTQLELLTKIFELIVRSDSRCVSSIDCINLVGQLKRQLSHTEAEDFITEMIKRMWLTLNDGQIYMGMRSIVEFMPLFKSKFRDSLANCPLCKQTVFHGHQCPNCDIIFHVYCLENFAKLSPTLTCSNCKADLTEGNSSDDNMPMDVEDEPQPQPSTSRKTSRRGSRRNKA